jgi:hypothetical protein
LGILGEQFSIFQFRSLLMTQFIEHIQIENCDIEIENYDKEIGNCDIEIENCDKEIGNCDKEIKNSLVQVGVKNFH